MWTDVGVADVVAIVHRGPINLIPHLYNDHDDSLTFASPIPPSSARNQTHPPTAQGHERTNPPKTNPSPNYTNTHHPKPKMSYLRITLHRTAIGLPQRTPGVLAALGLHRRGQLVFHPVHPQFAGMIMKVKELVRVEEVERALTRREVYDERRPEAGFWVESAGAKGAFGGEGKQEEGEVRL